MTCNLEEVTYGLRFQRGILTDEPTENVHIPKYGLIFEFAVYWTLQALDTIPSFSHFPAFVERHILVAANRRSQYSNFVAYLSVGIRQTEDKQTCTCFQGGNYQR